MVTSLRGDHRQARAGVRSGRTFAALAPGVPAGTSTAAAVAWTALIAVLFGTFVVGIGLGIASSAP